MPTLYTMPGTCALAPNIAIAWLGAPVDVHTMDYGDHKKPDYLAINDKAKVPALRFDADDEGGGDVLTEAAAILSYLGAAHGDGSYARDTKLGRKEAEALSYMTSEVHAAYAGHFAPGSLADGDDAQAAVKKKAYETLGGHYQRMDQILTEAGGDWYLGQKSFADAYLYVLCRWIEQTPMSMADYPALANHRARMEADEGVKTALERQKMKPVG